MKQLTSIFLSFAFALTFTGCSGSGSGITPDSRTAQLITRGPVVTINPQAVAFTNAIRGIPASQIHAATTPYGQYEVAQGEGYTYIGIWDPTATESGGTYSGAYLLYDTLRFSNQGTWHLYYGATAWFRDGQGTAPVLPSAAQIASANAAGTTLGITPLADEAPIPSCATNGTCNSDGADVSVSMNSNYTPIIEDDTSYGFVGYYEVGGGAVAGMSVPKMTADCASKAAALQSAQENYAWTFAAVILAIGAVSAADFVTVGAGTIVAVGAAAIAIGQLHAATTGLLAQQLDYRNSHC